MILEGVEGNTLRTWIDFIVIDCDSSYNGILRRLALWKIKAFIAGHMLMMKLPSPAGIVTIRGDQLAARGCYAINQDNGRRRVEILISGSPKTLTTDAYEDPRVNATIEGTEAKRPGSVEETELICISNEFLARTTKIGTGLPPRVKEKLMCFLKANNKAFAWSYADVPGILRDIVTHRLGIRKGMPPGEVQRLLDIQFIKEARYPQWLANVIIVPKKVVGQWRMCVDYTSLNRACPKDSFSLPRIDQLVDSTSRFKMLSFMDAYAGYNQIMMDTADEEHTAFTTDKGMYYYKRIPFSLKNAEAAYQRLMNKMFAKQLGVTMEV
ncbi:PREDICTED: enzymatic polyprotein-like [Fragaria vesca subsp. vesca]